MESTNWVSSLPSMITALASIITALGVIFLWVQSRLLQRQLEADHERSRRELTLTLMHQWNASISPVTAAAQKIVEKLSFDQCRALANFQPFKLDSEHRPLLETCLSEVLAGDPREEQGGQIKLSPKQVTRLRFQVAEYLNETETVVMGWHMSVVDRGVIEHEFQFLYDEKTGDNALGNFRQAMGGEEAFPALEEFGKVIRQKRKQREGTYAKPPVA